MISRNLKIAVQLYGHLRTFETCAPLLRTHLLDLYDCDVFIHTWDRTEHTTKSWYDDAVRAEPTVVNDAVLARIQELYAPKGLKVESQGFLSETGYFGTHNSIQISLLGLKYMAYGQYQANALREEYQKAHHLDYDYVVVLRPDIMPFVDLDFSRFSREFSFHPRTSIHFVHNSEMKLRGGEFFNYPLVADCFYFSTPQVVSDIAGLYLVFDRYFKEINSILPEGVENPELGFFEHIVQNNISPRQYRFYFAIKRKDSKNDIRLLPPLQTSSTAFDPQVSRKRQIMKAMLQYHVRYSPKVVKDFISRLLQATKLCSDYIDTLERTK